MPRLTRLLLLLWLVLLPTAAHAAIAEVGAGSQRAKGQFDNGTTAGIAFPGNVGNANLVIAAGACWRNTGVGTLTVSDTRTTAYTTRQYFSNVDANYMVFIAYGVTPSSGANTVTVTAPNANTYCSWGIDEFSGVDPANPTDVDGGGVTTASTASPSSTITTRVANALIIGALLFETTPVTTITPGGSYAQISEEEDNSAHQAFNTEFRNDATTATTYTVDWALSVARVTDIYVIAFQPTAAAGSSRAGIGFGVGPGMID
jgi:hypothetical protein